jgi:hypothetical protein
MTSRSPLLAKRTPTPQSRSAHAIAAQSLLPAQKEVAALALRTIFLNLFRHNSARLNSARYESGWRFTLNICWRDGEPIPCPVAVGREITGRAGHQVDIEFVVSIVDATLSTKIRVDDAHTLDAFPSIKLGTGYVKELRALLEQHLGLVYPKVEEKPAEGGDTKGHVRERKRTKGKQ